jgi:hypothetical protein
MTIHEIFLRRFHVVTPTSTSYHQGGDLATPTHIHPTHVEVHG